MTELQLAEMRQARETLLIAAANFGGLAPAMRDRCIRDANALHEVYIGQAAAQPAVQQPAKAWGITYNGVLQPTIYESEDEAAQEVKRRQDTYPHDNAPRAVMPLWSVQQPAEDAPPFGSKRAAALALYRPPFKFRGGYIHDAGGHMVADQDGFGEGSKVFDSIAARVRGWGRIGYMPDAEALQDEVGAVIADALTAYWSAVQHPQQEQPK